MNKEELRRILPHRDPMLLVDEVTLAGEVATGKYTVRGDEFFLQGHFPGQPVVPGVILCEMMAQSACLLVTDSGQGHFTPFLTGLDKMRFKSPVKPGDTVVFTSRLTRARRPFYFVSGTGHVEGQLAVSGELSFAIIEGD